MEAIYRELGKHRIRKSVHVALDFECGRSRSSGGREKFVFSTSPSPSHLLDDDNDGSEFDEDREPLPSPGTAGQKQTSCHWDLPARQRRLISEISARLRGRVGYKDSCRILEILGKCKKVNCLLEAINVETLIGEDRCGQLPPLYFAHDIYTSWHP